MMRDQDQQLRVLIVGAFGALSDLLHKRGHSVTEWPSLDPDLRKHAGNFDLMFLEESVWQSQSDFKSTTAKLMPAVVFSPGEVDEVLFKRVREDGAKACFSKLWDEARLIKEFETVRSNEGLIPREVRVLVVDNNSQRREPLGQGLSALGYSVKATSNPTEARAAIEEHEPHVVVTYLSLNDDADDMSGLQFGIELAESQKDSIKVVVLSLTGFQYQPGVALVDVLRIERNRLIYDLDKTIRANVESLGLDTALEIGFLTPLSWERIAGLIRTDCDIPLTSLKWGLTDIIRKLFYRPPSLVSYRQRSLVNICGVLDSEGETAAVFVTPIRNQVMREQFLVRFGSWKSIENEEENYNDHGPLLLPHVDLLGSTAKTMRLKGLKLSFAGRFPKSPRDFATFYHQEENPDNICNSVSNFITKTCRSWYPVAGSAVTNPEIIERYLSSIKKRSKLQTIRGHVEEILNDKRFPNIKFTREHEGKRIRVTVGHVSSEIDAPDPVDFVENLSPGEMFRVWGTANASFNGRNVLVDTEANLLLTDFHNTGSSPVLQDFSYLEAMVKFELMHASNFTHLFEFERALLTDSFLGELPPSDRDPEVSKALCVIKRIRNLAHAKYDQDDIRELFVFLLIRALKMLLWEGVADQDRDRYHIRKRYALLSAAMIARQLEAKFGMTADEKDPADPPAQRPIEVFFSYAHEDEEMRDRLAKHLSLLVRQNLIRSWHDREITASTAWEREIGEHLKRAEVILLLISSDFIASKYCYDDEMQLAMKRHVEGTARVVPIILRPCDWEYSPFAGLQALPKDAKPISQWPDRDEAFTDVAKGLRRLVEELLRR